MFHVELLEKTLCFYDFTRYLEKNKIRDIMREINMNIPKEVKFIISELEKNGFESFIVGGCVRDLFNGKEPNDWDVATLAEPKEIEKIFPENYANNDFGTVTVRVKKAKGGFFDKRHPDEIKWAKSIEEDLKRRDFTVNAMALGVRSIFSMGPQPLGQIYGKGAGGTYPEEKTKIDIIDLFEGQKDLKNKIIKIFRRCLKDDEGGQVCFNLRGRMEN